MYVNVPRKRNLISPWYNSLGDLVYSTPQKTLQAINNEKEIIADLIKICFLYILKIIYNKHIKIKIKAISILNKFECKNVGKNDKIL